MIPVLTIKLCKHVNEYKTAKRFYKIGDYYRQWWY